MSKDCSHCSPYTPTHLSDRVDFLVAWLLVPIVRLVPERLTRAVWSSVLTLLVWSRLGVWRPLDLSVHEGKRYELWHSAMDRGLSVQHLFVCGFPTSTHRYRKEKHWVVMDEFLNPARGVRAFPHAINDKGAMRRVLSKASLPIPEGRVFWRVSSAVSYLQSAGDCVIKSRDGSLSKHVMIKPDDFFSSVKIVQQVCPSVIVEQFVEGDVYRATTVHGRLVAVMRRDPIALGKKVVMADGARMIDVTDRVHEKNRELFECTASVVGGAILGVDFITTDVSVPWEKSGLKLIELNSFPNFDMHTHPDEGIPRDIAGAYWDGVLNSNT